MKRGRKTNVEIREKVDKYLKKGLSYNEIARILHITPQYVGYIKKKLSTKK